MRRLFIAFLIIPLLVHSVQGAPAKARPLTGIGLLIMGPSVSPEQDKPAALILYRDPGIGRIVELTCSTIPLLSRVMTVPPGEYPVAVLGKKGAWLKIAYDEAGREGWLEQERSWNYIPWDEYLPEHSARLLSGLKKSCYIIRQQPAEASEETANLTPEKTFRILEIREDWARVDSAAASGWLQWRDSDGRFLIFDGGRNPQ